MWLWNTCMCIPVRWRYALLASTLQHSPVWTYNTKQLEVFLVSWWKSIMWPQFVLDTFKLQINGYLYNYSDNIRQGHLLYWWLSNGNFLINKLQAGDMILFQNKSLLSQNTWHYKSGLFKAYFLDNELYPRAELVIGFVVTSVRN